MDEIFELLKAPKLVANFLISCRKFQNLKIYHSLEEFNTLNYAVATTGTFDGVHVGHRKILARLKEVAQKNNGESVLFTFHPHPRLVLQPDLDLKLITDLQEKVDLLEDCGIDHLIIHPFTKEFSRMSSLEFIRSIMVKHIGIKKLVIGYDHHFGRNREGSFEHLKEFGPVYGFDVEEIPAQDVDDVHVSSTKIRNALLNGDVATTNKYLIEPYRLTGFVVKGDKLGRTIGFATANVKIDHEHKLIPKDGAYAVKAKIGNKTTLLNGMCNIGVRPTVEGTSKTIEVHLFDFDQDIYGENVRLFFYHRIRDERKFQSLDDLKEQLQKDRAQCESLLS